MYARAASAWILMMLLESAAAVVRQQWILPAIGQPNTAFVAMLIGMTIILTVTLATLRWINPFDQELMGLGLFWMLLTLFFELTLARGILAQPWSAILFQYDLRQFPRGGGLMLFGLAWMQYVPRIAARILHYHRELTGAVAD